MSNNRDNGNAAAMRAALELVIQLADDGMIQPRSKGDDDEHCFVAALDMARAALSAPARNCDVVLIENLARRNIADIVWAAFRETHPKAYLDVPGLLQCINWLFDKAKEAPHA